MSYSHQKDFSWLRLLTIALVAFAVFFILISYLSKTTPYYRGPRTEALHNAKAIAGGLIAFKADHGHFPCDATRETLVASGITNLPAGSDANAYFAQLIATDIIDSETYFYASGVKGTFKGDDFIGTSAQLLAPGENSFAYVMTKNGQPLRDLTSQTPLVLAPVKSATSNPTFDPNPYDHKCVYGMIDGSAKIANIDQEGHAITEDGAPLFATGPGTSFPTETPVIIPPTPKKSK